MSTANIPLGPNSPMHEGALKWLPKWGFSPWLIVGMLAFVEPSRLRVVQIRLMSKIGISLATDSNPMFP